MQKIQISYGKTSMCRGEELVGVARLNGEPIAFHLSSNLGWLKKDMSDQAKLLIYENRCPEGYELVWDTEQSELEGVGQ